MQSAPDYSSQINERDVMRKILIIDNGVPIPDRDAGSMRLHELLKIIKQLGYDVTFYPNDRRYPQPYSSDLVHLGISLVRNIDDHLKRHGREYGVVILSRPDIATAHISTIRHLAPQAKLIFDTVDLHHIRQEREAALLNNEQLHLHAVSRKKQELLLVEQSDITIVVSPTEKALLLKDLPSAQIHVIPTIIDIKYHIPARPENRHNIIFIGSFGHPPNVDAVLYFTYQILPLIRHRSPEIHFDIIGPNAPAVIQSLASDTIVVHGHVKDIMPLFSTARLSIAPLRFGAGVKGKVNMSMSLGVPVVATSIAAEGMHLTHENTAMIADNPVDFANCITRLLRSEELWQHISTEGLNNVQTHFSIQAVTELVKGLLASS